MTPEDPVAKASAPELASDVPAPLYYQWASPDAAIVVRLSYDVVDDVNFEVMKGFGAIPRRGAEVGGILLGNVEGSVVTVTGFRAIPCRHSQGPSYILLEDELENLRRTLVEFGPDSSQRQRAVGFFRSNTRDALELSSEDQDLLERFPLNDRSIVLMVKPYATRVSEATIFWRAAGSWTSGGVESVFPFRRSELGGGKRQKRPRQVPVEALTSPRDAGPAAFEIESPYLPAPRSSDPPSPRTPLFNPPEVVAAPMEPIVPGSSGPPPGVSDAAPISFGAPGFATVQQPKPRGRWVWVPLSFIFLLLGIVLGFQIALSVSRTQKAAEQELDPYSLDLKVVEFGESLHLKWNTSMPALKDAQRGVLHIRDGNNSKTVEITRDDIVRSGIIYRNATPDVEFRLEIPQKERTAVSETIGVHVSAPAPQ